MAGNRGAGVVVLTLLIAAPARAERPITYEEALRAALEANALVLGAQASVDQAEGSLMASRGAFDPVFFAIGEASRASYTDFAPSPFRANERRWDIAAGFAGDAPTGTSWAVQGDVGYFSEYVDPTEFPGVSVTDVNGYGSAISAEITQHVLEGSRLAYNLQYVTIARQGVDRARLDLDRQRQQVLADTAGAYWTWVYTTRLAEIADEAVVVAEEALRVGRLRVQAGDLAPVEQTRLEAALVQAQADQIRARNEAVTAANALLLLMGEPPAGDLLPATNAEDVPAVDIDPAKAVEVAVAQNLDLALARADVDIARTELKAARHATLPTLSATLQGSVSSPGYETATGEPPATASRAVSDLFNDERQPGVALIGELEVPLGNRAARGARDRATASVYAAELTLAETERQVRAAVDAQVRTLQSARRQVELADANLRLAEETLRAEEALSRAGRIIQKDVLEARDAVERARAEAVRARTDYRVAQVELMRLQGQLAAP